MQRKSKDGREEDDGEEEGWRGRVEMEGRKRNEGE